MSDFWQQIVQGLQSYGEQTLASAVAPFLAHSLAVLVLALITLGMARFASRAVQRATQQTTKDADFALLLGRVVHLGVSGLGVGWMLSVVGVPFAALAGFFGFFGLGLSMSLADVLKSLIAGAYLLMERPYWLGTSVVVKGLEGTVEEMRLRTTRLRMSDGRMVIVPNTIMLTEAVICGTPAPPEQAQH